MGDVHIETVQCEQRLQQLGGIHVVVHDQHRRRLPGRFDLCCRRRGNGRRVYFGAQGQGDLERCAAAVAVAVRRERAAVAQDQVARQRQADAQATVAIAAAAAFLREHVEQAGEHVRRNTAARIRDPDAGHAVRPGADVEMDVALIGRELEGIVQQVRHALGDARAVDVHGNRLRRQRQLEVGGRLFDHRCARFQRAGDHVTQVGRRDLQCQLGRVDT